MKIYNSLFDRIFDINTLSLYGFHFYIIFSLFSSPTSTLIFGVFYMVSEFECKNNSSFLVLCAS